MDHRRTYFAWLMVLLKEENTLVQGTDVRLPRIVFNIPTKRKLTQRT